MLMINFKNTAKNVNAVFETNKQSKLWLYTCKLNLQQCIEYLVLADQPVYTGVFLDQQLMSSSILNQVCMLFELQ